MQLGLSLQIAQSTVFATPSRFHLAPVRRGWGFSAPAPICVIEVRDGRSAVTRNESKALLQKILDELVEDGLIRVVGIDERGRKRYVSTEAGKSRHLVVNPPRTKQ